MPVISNIVLLILTLSFLLIQPQPDDNEPQHVLIVGDTETNIAKAAVEIERILFADEETRFFILA